MNIQRLITIAGLLASPLAFGDDEAGAPETEVAVQVGKVVRTTLRRVVTCYGTVEPEMAGPGKFPAAARLAPAVPGIISEVNATEGQAVAKGDIIFRLDSRAADAAVTKAELTIEFARNNAERQRRLIAAEGTSAKLLQEAEQALAQAEAELAAARVQQSLLRGEAPLAGTLTKLNARPGEAADASTVLAEIIDLDRLVAAVHLPQAEAVVLKPGQDALVRPTRGSGPVKASVRFVSPAADPATDTVSARLALPAGSVLRPGEFVAAQVIVEEHADRLAVPRASVHTDGEGVSRLSIVEGDTARQVVVRAGIHDGDLIEVEGGGLQEGATVVTVGSYALPEETRVRVLTGTGNQ